MPESKQSMILNSMAHMLIRLSFMRKDCRRVTQMDLLVLEVTVFPNPVTRGKI